MIEPTFAVDYTTNFNKASSTPLLSDISDYVIAGASRYTYGVNNRLFYRGKTVDGLRGQGVHVGPDNLKLAENATLILPLHRELDQLRTCSDCGARNVGIAYVGLKNTGHIGAAGYFASTAAREGCIAMVTGNDIPSVAAPGRCSALSSNCNM